MGRLKTQGKKEKFILYDTSNGSTQNCDHGCFHYRYEPCNVGNIRKMLVLLPNVVAEGEQQNDNP